MPSLSAGAATVDATGATIFDRTVSKVESSAFMVKVLATSAFPALVNIPMLHLTGEFFPIPIGDKEYFRVDHGKIMTVFVKGDGGASNIIFGNVAHTTPV